MKLSHCLHSRPWTRVDLTLPEYPGVQYLNSKVKLISFREFQYVWPYVLKVALLLFENWSLDFFNVEQHGVKHFLNEHSYFQRFLHPFSIDIEKKLWEPRKSL